MGHQINDYTRKARNKKCGHVRSIINMYILRYNTKRTVSKNLYIIFCTLGINQGRP